jgi:hypothetical protein
LQWSRSPRSQPQKGTFELLGVEAVGLGAPVLAWHRNTRGMNDVGLNPACRQPARQPEAIPTGLEGDRNALDLVAGLLRFLLPSLEQLQEFVLVGCELLQRLALHAGDDPGNEPTFFSHFNHGD